MRLGTKQNVRGYRLALVLITLTCTTLVIWTCNQVPILSIHPLEQLDVFSPAIPLPSPTVTTNYLAKDLSVVGKVEVSAPLRSSDILTDLPNLQQSANEGLSVVERIKNNHSEEIIFNISPVGSAANSSLRDGVDKDLTSVPSVLNACNYGKGKWIKVSSRPLYSGFGCKKFLSAIWACRLMKRTDFSYESFQWKPQGCDLPEFSGSKFLQRMQNKTIALVGDSLGRQQFQSLMCMITAGKPNPRVNNVGREYGFAKASGAIRPDGWAYRFPKTNTTILFYWSASLCQLEPLNASDPATNYAIHLDRPATFLIKYLHKIDVLVLNTGHHWNRVKFTANRWKMYIGGKPNTNRKLADMASAKNLTIHSVVKWLDSRLLLHPRLKTFLRTISPRHFVNGDWNSGGSCDSAVPLANGSEVSRDGSADLVAEAAVRGTRVRLLDITALSQLRDEGHISRCSFKSWKGRYDCLHWCLPGIPDTWNEMLYAQL